MVPPDPENVAVRRKNCPINVLEHDLAPVGTDTQSLSANCKRLLTKGRNGFDNSWDCVCQDRWLTVWKMLRAQLSLEWAKAYRYILIWTNREVGYLRRRVMQNKVATSGDRSWVKQNGDGGRGKRGKSMQCKNLRAQKHSPCLDEDELITEFSSGITSAWLWMPCYS